MSMRLAQARLAACKKWPFASQAILSMVPVPRPGLGTLAVDKHWRLYYDEAFLAGISTDLAAGVILHEVDHLLKRHHKRAANIVADTPGGWDAWNRATDAAINGGLRAEGIALPDGGIYPETLEQEDGLSAEEYFRALRKAADEQKQSEEVGDDGETEAVVGEESENAGGGEGEGDGTGGEASGGEAESDGGDEGGGGGEDGADGGEPGPEGEAGEAGGGGGTPREADGGDTGRNAGDEPGEGSEAGGSVGSANDGQAASGDDGSEGRPGGDGEGSTGTGGETGGQGGGTGQGSAGSQGGGGAGGGTDGDVAGDCRKPGGALDGSEAGNGGNAGRSDWADDPVAPNASGSCSDGQTRPWELGDPSDDAPGLDADDAEAIIRVTAENAARGTGGANRQRWAKDILEPECDPAAVLRHLVREAVAMTSGVGERSYRRPSRRDYGPIVMPCNMSPIPKLTVIVDTSGSMSELSDLPLALGMVRRVLDAYRIQDGIRVVTGDMDCQTSEFTLDPTTMDLRGGGGTDMGMLVRQVVEDDDPPHIVLVVTDGYTPWSEDVGIPVVACLTQPERTAYPVPEWMEKVELFR